MATINVAGYSWNQRQSEGEWRLQQCNEFSGRHLTDSDNPVIPAAYKSCSHAKQMAWERCVKIASEVPYSSYPVVIGKNCDKFTVGFYTIDPSTGEIDRVYWITPGGKYYADLYSGGDSA